MMTKRTVTYRESIIFILQEFTRRDGIRDFAFFTHDELAVDSITTFFFRLALQSNKIKSVEAGDGVSLKLMLFDYSVSYVSFHVISHTKELDAVKVTNFVNAFAWLDIRKTTKQHDEVIIYLAQNESTTL